ncbi:MAG TPA: isocitrate lyase/phosphoenolpyruvate mutase family protein [Bryobacteraceae bacterium]
MSSALPPEKKSPKSALLRKLLASSSPTVIAGAHDGLGARLVEEAGFDGVWASGFEVSAAHGVPDASIITMTEMLESARIMNQAVTIPVVADCDTGFGNAINAIRTVELFEAAGIGGICIEDNVFPKRCSFYTGVSRHLAPVEEQRLKIQAALDARASPDFVVIARTEALVAGCGTEEALRRAAVYADTGADAILVHSKQSTVDELAEFARAWKRPTPLVCVPTTYHRASVEELSRLGFKMIVFANHGLRAAVSGMQTALRKLRQTGVASSIEDEIAPIAEIFRLVNLDRLRAEERNYLPSERQDPTTPVAS